MTIEEFNRMMEENSKKIADYVIRPTVVDLISSIRNRVINTGRSENRNLFSSYSDAYRKQKSKRHQNVTFKNFSDTGTMWDSFGIKEQEHTLGKSVIIARMDDDSRDDTTNQGLLEIHSDYERKELIAPTDEEIKKMYKIANDLMQELWA